MVNTTWHYLTEFGIVVVLLDIVWPKNSTVWHHSAPFRPVQPHIFLMGTVLPCLAFDPVQLKCTSYSIVFNVPFTSDYIANPYALFRLLEGVGYILHFTKKKNVNVLSEITNNIISLAF